MWILFKIEYGTQYFVQETADSTTDRYKAKEFETEEEAKMYGHSYEWTKKGYIAIEE